MVASEVTIEDKLARCVQDYADDRYSLLELLRFLGKHPYTRFSRAAIVLALRNQGVLVGRGLKYLVDIRIVTIETDKNIRLYSLTSREPECSWAQELVSLDWHQWQSVLKRIACTE